MSYQKRNIDIKIVNAVTAGIKRDNIKLNEVPLMQIASILTEANLDYFRSEVERIFKVRPDDEDEKLLEINSIVIEERKVYSLNDTTRNKVLQGMQYEDIRALAKEVAPYSKDVMQMHYLKLIAGVAKQVDAMTLDELVATYNISQWCKNTSIKLPDLDLVNIRISQKELQLPLTRITKNFKGRQEELKQLENYYKVRHSYFWNNGISKLFNSKAVKKPVFITGIGGTGKSTLVSKSILDQLSKGRPPIFIYIDFDRPGISIGNVFSLVKEALRQWVIQTPKFENIFKSSDEIIEFDYGSSNKKVGSALSDRRLLYERIFTKDNIELLKNLREPVIVVFDSFEELQYRAKPSEIQFLLDFLREVGEFIPQLRPVFVGRSQIASDVDSFEMINLAGFDKAAATGLLDSMGIVEAKLQKHIYETFGNSPLTLKLAANLIVKQIENVPKTFDIVEKHGLFSQIDQKLIQEELVARNLEHIHARDKRVKQIAALGILVRKINPSVILHILAKPCGLNVINLRTAENLFKKLKRESFLFEYHGADIMFRQDLRRALYPRILKNSYESVIELHDAAIEYYKDKIDPSDRAEYLYHRLMRGDDPGIIDDLYTIDMRDYIEKAMVEFPEKAYLHFAVVLGHVISDSQLQTLALTDWEVYMRRKTKEVLRKGNKDELIRLGHLYEQRNDRLGRTNIWKDEVYVWFRLNNNNKISLIIQPIMNSLMKGSEDWLFIRLMQFKRAEYTFSWHNLASDLKEDIPQFDHSDLNTVYYLFYHSIQLYRGDCRLGNDVEKSILRVKFNALIMGKLLMEKDGNMSRFFSLLPYPYVFFFEQEYKKHLNLAVNKILPNEVDFFVSYLTERKLYFRSKKSFHKIFNYFLKHYPTIIDLERYLKRHFGVFLKDITGPGEYPILLYEAILFVEIHPDFESSAVISSAAQFYKVRGMLSLAAFTENDEVTRCLSKLKQVFHRQKLHISDLQDNEGHQYVNLVLNGQGIHGFALLGFTYVMEEMGIRFHRISGAGAGALHAAFLSVAYTEGGVRSRKLLEKYCELDFRKLRDGGRVYNKFFLDLVSKGTILVWLTILCTFTLFLISLIFIKMMNFSWTSFATGKNIFFWLGLSTSLVFSVFMLKFFKLNKGEGINSGKALHNWIKSIFDKEDILTIEDLERRVMSEDVFRFNNDLRYLSTHNQEPRLKMVAAEMVTSCKIVFPEMYDLFRSEENRNSLSVADIIHACMASPVFFKTVSIRNIPNSSNSVINAWKKRFGITDIPSTAFLSATGISPIIKGDIKDGTPLLPSFGAFVERYRHNKKSFSNGLNAYFARLIRRMTEADEENRGDEKVIYKRGITKISINNQRYHSLNYGLTGEDKIELFIKGVSAATEFLINFNWQDYKEQLSIIRKQREVD